MPVARGRVLWVLKDCPSALTTEVKYESLVLAKRCIKNAA
jgi:hypothetical protein